MILMAMKLIKWLFYQPANLDNLSVTERDALLYDVMETFCAMEVSLIYMLYTYTITLIYVYIYLTNM